MNRAHTITTTTIDRWLLPHIGGTLAYADQHPAFAWTLATWLAEESWSLTPTTEVTPSSYLMPADSDQAEDILDWLMNELSTHPEARIARSLMVTWANNYESPQDLLIGVEGLALTGFPLGLTSKKKQKSQLQIVVNQAWQKTQTFSKLAEQTHDLSQKLIADELRKAGGKIDSLHPDTAEWCMATAQTKLYETDHADLKTLRATAETEGLHHLAEQFEGTITMIAISPNVKDTFVTDLVAD